MDVTNQIHTLTTQRRRGILHQTGKVSPSIWLNTKRIIFNTYLFLVPAAKRSLICSKNFINGSSLTWLPWWVGYVCHLTVQQIRWELAGKRSTSDSGPWQTHWPVQMCSVFPPIRQLSERMEREPLMQYVIHHTLESVTLESYLQSTRSTFLK